MYSDPCQIAENDGGAYSHPKSCKQYWRCEGGISVAKCCPGYERYNKRTGECEYKRGAPCFDECELGAGMLDVEEPIDPGAPCRGFFRV